jgi:hypothetical protein
MSETCPRCGRTCCYVIQNGQCIQCHDRDYLAADAAWQGEWNEAVALARYLGLCEQQSRAAD